MKTRLYILFTIIFAFGLAGLSCEGPTGSDGPAGQQGDQGPDGPQGPVGPAGEDGTNMHAGPGVPDGELGAPGDFYLDLTTGDLYGPKTEESWGTPINLQGPEGPPGEDGNDGQDGADGNDGQDGADGNDGQDGADGNDGQDGADGNDGQDGAPGPQGPAGPAGQDGSQIFAGDGMPDDRMGSEGDYYLDKINFLLYGPKTVGGWGTPINLQGPIGPQGEQGPEGPEGPQGPQGPEGPQGPPGEDGEDGQDGADGRDGQDGNANVTLYIFNDDWDFSQPFSETWAEDIPDDLSEIEMNRSVWLVYLRNSVGTTYHVPGWGSGDQTSYSVINFWSAVETVRFNISRVDGPGELYDSIRIFRIQATTIVSKQQSIFPAGLDVSDYHAVMEYYGLDEADAIREM